MQISIDPSILGPAGDQSSKSPLEPVQGLYPSVPQALQGAADDVTPSTPQSPFTPHASPHALCRIKPTDEPIEGKRHVVVHDNERPPLRQRCRQNQNQQIHRPGIGLHHIITRAPPPQQGSGGEKVALVSPSTPLPPAIAGVTSPCGNVGRNGSSGYLQQHVNGCHNNVNVSSGGRVPHVSLPVRFRVRHHCLAGVANALSDRLTTFADSFSTFDTYTLDLRGVDHFFGSSHQSWNRGYDAAQQIFGSGALSAGLRGAIHTQHASLYAGIVKRESRFHSGMEFLRGLHFGVRGGAPRAYTYVILTNGKMRFSETGAEFLKDKLSKHAVHANASPEVRFAGEFHIPPFPTDGSSPPLLVIDNNSGTYAPNKDMLPRVADLLRHNFPDLHVEALDREDPKYKNYITDLKERQQNKKKERKLVSQFF